MGDAAAEELENMPLPKLKKHPMIFVK